MRIKEEQKRFEAEQLKIKEWEAEQLRLKEVQIRIEAEQR